MGQRGGRGEVEVLVLAESYHIRTTQYHETSTIAQSNGLGLLTPSNPFACHSPGNIAQPKQYDMQLITE